MESSSLTTDPNSLQILKRVLAKPFVLREEDEIHEVADLIKDFKYFVNIVHDPKERLDFVTKCAQYLKYEYYPKGFEVFRRGDEGENFYVIIQGETFVFLPKSEQEMEQDLNNEQKKIALENYTAFMKKTLAEDLPTTASAAEKSFGKKILKRSASSMYVPMSSGSVTAQKLKENLIREKFLNPDVIENQANELTFEEKLLIINEKSSSNPFFQNGIATQKKSSVLYKGDHFGELALLFNQPRTASIIASEDLHLLTLSNANYKDLFDSEIKNLWKKVNFFKKIFTDLSPIMIAKFCYMVEEKKFCTGEIIYKENDNHDGIYIIMDGEVQLSKTVDAPVETEQQETLPKLKKFIKRRKLIVANLLGGSFFGELEVINNTKREYTAVSRSSSTLVFKISSKKFESSVQRHFPTIENFLQEKAILNDQARKNLIAKQLEFQSKAALSIPLPSILQNQETPKVIKLSKRSKLINNQIEIKITDNFVDDTPTTPPKMLSIASSYLKSSAKTSSKDSKVFDFDLSKINTPKKLLSSSLFFPQISTTASTLFEDKLDKERGDRLARTDSSSIFKPNKIPTLLSSCDSQSPLTSTSCRKDNRSSVKPSKKSQFIPLLNFKQTEESEIYGFVDIFQNRRRSPKKLTKGLHSSFTKCESAGQTERDLSAGEIVTPRGKKKISAKELLLKRISEQSNAAISRTERLIRGTSTSFERKDSLEGHSEPYFISRCSTMKEKGNRISSKESSISAKSIILNLESLQKVDHEFVENNALLSNRYANHRISKTKHNQFRVFKGTS